MGLDGLKGPFEPKRQTGGTGGRRAAGGQRSDLFLSLGEEFKQNQETFSALLAKQEAKRSQNPADPALGCPSAATWRAMRCLSAEDPPPASRGTRRGSPDRPRGGEESGGGAEGGDPPQEEEGEGSPKPPGGQDSPWCQEAPLQLRSSASWAGRWRPAGFKGPASPPRDPQLRRPCPAGREGGGRRGRAAPPEQQTKRGRLSFPDGLRQVGAPAGVSGWGRRGSGRRGGRAPPGGEGRHARAAAGPSFAHARPLLEQSGTFTSPPTAFPSRRDGGDGGPVDGLS